MIKYDIVALGEILIDYTPMKKSASGMQVFEQNPGGAPANVLACATKLGNKTAFIGKVGADMQGQFLKETLEKSGVEIRGVVSDSRYFTTLAFVSLSDTGERSFSFARKPGADTMLEIQEVNSELLDNASIFHFGSLSLTHQPIHDTTIHAIKYAKRMGATISYDPNYRALLWENEKVAVRKMRSVLSYVDILKVSDEEAELMTGEADLYAATKALLDLGIDVVAITLGADGALIANNEGVRRVPSFRTDEVVDTTGAGDSFWGAILYKIAESKKTPNQLNIDSLEEIARFGNASASLCVRKRGGIPAMPELDDVLELLTKKI